MAPACCRRAWRPRSRTFTWSRSMSACETSSPASWRRCDNVSLQFGDALELDLAALDPPPDKVVANLPYGIAATVILRTIDELPVVGQWVVMVQREVGERFAAAPGTAAYGVPSVLAQLACEVEGAAAGRAYGVPPGAERRLGAARAAPGRPRRRSRGPDARARRLRAPPQGAGRFAGAGPGRRAGRPRARAGRAGGARPSRRRARRAPGAATEFRELAPALRHDGPCRRAGARQDQPVPVPRAGAGRRPPRARDAVRLGRSLCDELEVVDSSAPTRSSARAWRVPTW